MINSSSSSSNNITPNCRRSHDRGGHATPHRTTQESRMSRQEWPRKIRISISVAQTVAERSNVTNASVQCARRVNKWTRNVPRLSLANGRPSDAQVLRSNVACFLLFTARCCCIRDHRILSTHDARVNHVQVTVLLN